MKRTIRLLKETVDIRSGLLARIRSHRHFPIALLGAAFLVASFIHIWQRFQVFELVNEVAQLRQERAALVDEARKIESDIATLSLASRIESYAMDSLGMQRIKPDHLFTLQTSDPTGKPPGKMESLLAALDRMASHLPVVAESNVSAQEIRSINLDSLRELGGGR